ncbi:hypothetical protein V500_10548 [Pseudogymnoascus sp. VKM F-4518 (FW-2643)]|nr:hypothetical protein V500_10548 [Pseudogymnoascus sp. VKM F-4518 (FW-2643)]
MSWSAKSHTSGDSCDQFPPPLNQSQTSPASRGERGNTRKRRRVAVACKGCSSRKSRCDGGHPKCSSCQEMEVECIYKQPAQQAPQQQPITLNLELLSRLQAVEEMLKSFQETYPRLQEPSPGQHDAKTRRLSVQHASDSQSATSTLIGNGPNDRQTVPFAIEEDAVDGMGAIVLTDDEEEIGFFGASSNIALVKRITQVVAQTVNSTALNVNDFQTTHPRTPIPSPAVSKRHEKHNEDCRVNLYKVPAFAEGVALIRQFFATVGMMLPCFYEDHFLESYEQAAQNAFGGIRRPWLAILNMMFAFSTTVSTTSLPMKKFADESDTYYQRALGLATQDVLNSSSLETIQLSLLLSTYLMGTQRSMKTWTFHALAVNGALKVGLNSPQASKALPPLERELRKRAWFWCVTNDRMLFGRAPMIHSSLVNMDLPVDINDGFPSANVSSTLMASIIDHYRAYIELHNLMGHAVETLYNQNWGSDSAMTTHKTLAQKLDLSWKLAEWRHNLPSSLRIMTSLELQQDTNLPRLEPLRLRIFLTLRYLNVQILILRPILLKFLDHKFNPDHGEHEMALLQDSGLCTLQECSTACMEAINIIDMILKPVRTYEATTLHGAWWFNTYYVFNASLVLFETLLVCKKPSFQSLFTTSAILKMRRSLEQAVEALRVLDDDLPNTINPPLSENTPSTSTGNGQQVQIQDLNFFPIIQGIDAFSVDLDRGISNLGGLVMNSDYEFINNYYQTLPGQ